MGYTNPPWCLILSVLAKSHRDKTKVILVAPVWPTQPWYPLILQLLYDVPCLLPKRDDLVISPSQREFIMPTGVPQLAAWPLSGNSAGQEVFQQMLLGCSQHPGGTRPPHLMNPSSKCGTAGVWKGAEIPLEVRPIGHVANFLSELFQEGYQYRSLNAYRSAISSVHEKVVGELVG